MGTRARAVAQRSDTEGMIVFWVAPVLLLSCRDQRDWEWATEILDTKRGGRGVASQPLTKTKKIPSALTSAPTPGPWCPQDRHEAAASPPLCVLCASAVDPGQRNIARVRGAVEGRPLIQPDVFGAEHLLQLADDGA